jgi:anionic glutamate receptor
MDKNETDRVSRIKVLLHFQRDWYHHLLDMYLPSALFVMISWLSFWLEISAAPARVTLGESTQQNL